MPQFFIDRPVFAWVLAILIALGGVLALLRLPSEAYPAIAPPQVAITASYPGANAATVETTVTQVIEQQLTGIDNLLYFTSQSASDGSSTITLTFESGSNPDIAAVQTQNRVSLAEPRLPAEVNQQGIRIAKVAAGFLGGIGLVSAPGGPSAEELNNIVASRVLDTIQRVPGVGAAVQFGSEYAMRIWLDADKLKAYSLSASAVLAAVQSQNAQFASGSIGAWPALREQTTTATVTAEGRFTSPEQFEQILLRTESNGASVRLKDVARVSLGAAQYGFETSIGTTPIAAFGIQLAPEANALEVSKAVTERMNAIQGSFPAGVKWVWAWDSTPFIRVAIREVLITLIEAVVLVFLVMLVFLQNFRATLIPTLVVPSALLGTLIGMYVVGFSINQLSLFAMVLAIGIVVDDAIVVVEAVDRIMREEHLPPKEATRKAMQQITGAIVAITSVLAAVFIPSALQSGSTGVIYRQFALTIALSMGFSALLALSFTPALCASLLRPEHLKGNAVFNWFNRAFETTRATYVHRVYQSVGHVPRWMAGFAVMLAVGTLLFIKLPGSFVPDEDQGYALIDVQLPAGANLPRTREVMQHINASIGRSPDMDYAFLIVGSSFTGTGENAGRAFVHLKPWDHRPDSAAQFIAWANSTLSREIHDARVYVLNLPTVRGLGFFGGFDFYLEDRGGLGRELLTSAQETLLAKAAADKGTLSGVRANLLPPAPQLQLTVDRVQAQSMGLSASDVYTALQLMLAPVYANDFIYQGRVLRVLLQADSPWRMTPEALGHFYVAGAGGSMIPLANFVRADWVMGSPSLTRFNGYAAVEITGNNAPGRSSGQAMQAMQKIVNQSLPRGIGNDWAGQSLQELISGAQAPMLFALSILVVYLCLAALYESWSVPAAVLMAVPVGLIGTAIAALLRGLPNDVFFKVGLITIIGLSAKNAILIVEFAITAQRAGKSLHQGVLEAARLRFRPILMTSFAFILGVFPMVVSTGAGANARHAIGTGVVGGMLSAALLGVLLIPVCYVAVRRLMGEKLDAPAPASGAGAVPGPAQRREN
ncbi:MAG TPA: multidrug efflux RND transporter permease subunit [Steroidobacteraceae bacterium]|jgi:multidrug efflux pump|nr:multidrug efflux RND transporter permease subunit [Steroidobacteraceae bacterium]